MQTLASIDGIATTFVCIILMMQLRQLGTGGTQHVLFDFCRFVTPCTSPTPIFGTRVSSPGTTARDRSARRPCKELPWWSRPGTRTSEHGYSRTCLFYNRVMSHFLLEVGSRYVIGQVLNSWNHLRFAESQVFSQDDRCMLNQMLTVSYTCKQTP